MAVYIVKSSYENVEAQFKQMLDGLNYQPSKKDVLIKPNVVGPAPVERAVVTHPRVTEAAVEYFLNKGCTVRIGESSSIAQNTQHSFQVGGYTELAKKYSVELIDLDKAPRIKCSWKYGELEIPEMVFSHEYVNIAKMKTHIVTQVTLGLKNQKGLLLPKNKKQFHLGFNLDEAIGELAKIIVPDLTIIDGILALEGDGPGAGIPVNMGVLLAGKDVFEVDNVACNLMGFEKGEVRHIAPVDNIVTIGEAPDEVRKNFIKPKQNQINLGNVRFFSFRSCTGCTETLAISYYRGNRAKFSKPLDIIAGSEAKIQSAENPTVCYGDCAKSYAKERGLPHVPGCPPDPAKTYTIPDMIN